MTISADFVRFRDRIANPKACEIPKYLVYKLKSTQISTGGWQSLIYGTNQQQKKKVSALKFMNEIVSRKEELKHNTKLEKFISFSLLCHLAFNYKVSQRSFHKQLRKEERKWRKKKRTNEEARSKNKVNIYINR